MLPALVLVARAKVEQERATGAITKNEEEPSRQALVQGPWQADSTWPLAGWSPHYRLPKLLPHQKDATSQEKAVQGAPAPDLAVALVVRLPQKRLPRVF